MSLDAKEKLIELLKSDTEDEVLEFKTAATDFDLDKLGEYFSALSNEANLKDKLDAWLVFGVNNNKEVIGTRYRNTGGLQKLKHEIAERVTSGITFLEIHEVNYNGCRVILFQIPASPQGMPAAWNGHYYGRNGIPRKG